MIGLHSLNPLANATSGSASGPLRSVARHHQHNNCTSQQAEQHKDNIIRISAKTAPQIVSSVPKCAKKTSRSHPRDTINGAAINQQMDDYVTAGGSRSIMSDHHQIHRRGDGSHQQIRTSRDQMDQMVLIVNDDNQGAPIIGRRLPSKSMGSSLHEYHQAPSESMASIGGLIYNQEAFPPPMGIASASACGPVVGRRSNRILKQEQQQRASLIYQYEGPQYSQVEYGGEGSMRPQGGSERPSNRESYSKEQQPLSIVETHQVASQQVSHQQQHSRPLKAAKAKGRNTQPKTETSQRRLQSLSIINIADPLGDYNPTIPLTQHACETAPPRSARVKGGGGGGNPNTGRRSVRQNGGQTSIGSSPPVKSSPPSCPPGCPCGGAQPPPYQENLGLAHQLACNKVAFHCYEDYGESTGCPRGRSASCQRIPPCCANVPPLAHNILLTKRPSQPANKFNGCHCTSVGYPSELSPSNSDYHRSHMDHHIPEILPSFVHNNNEPIHHRDRSSASQRQPRTLVSHHHQHATCQANGPQASGTKGPSASYRSNSCHDHRAMRQPPPMLISGRNLLPVHPKPNINFPLNHQAAMSSDEMIIRESAAYTHRVAAAASEMSHRTRAYRHSPDLLATGGSEPDTGVSQMYESLAAELKAKLGDPKMGPILLPPKDYDTMSRKQGKLTGIELRRSTNPQLVGPTANRLSSATNCSSTLNEEPRANSAGASGGNQISARKTLKQPASHSNDPSSPVCGSSRSSGRSQDDRCLQRSRSNSSSGLGSISMGAGSPNSSPSSKSSSSEDMRQASSHGGAGLTSSHHCASIKSDNLTKITISGSRDNSQQLSGKLVQVSGSNLLSRTTNNNTTKTSLLAGRKNSSPDCCGASDSGHSESGPIDDQRKFSNRGIGSSDIYSKFNDPKQQESANKQPINSKSIKGIGESSSGHVSTGSVLWNGRVEVPLKVNSNKNNGNTYLATKQIIY